MTNLSKVQDFWFKPNIDGAYAAVRNLIVMKISEKSLTVLEEDLEIKAGLVYLFKNNKLNVLRSILFSKKYKNSQNKVDFVKYSMRPYTQAVELNPEYMSIRNELKNILGYSRTLELEEEMVFQELVSKIKTRHIKALDEFIDKLGMSVAKKYLLPEIFEVPNVKELLYLCEGLIDLPRILSICRYLKAGYKFYAIKPVYEQNFPLEKCELIIENRYDLLKKRKFKKAYSTV